MKHEILCLENVFVQTSMETGSSHYLVNVQTVHVQCEQMQSSDSGILQH